MFAERQQPHSCNFPGLLKKSAPVTAGEKRFFNVVERREAMWINGKSVQFLRP